MNVRFDPPIPATADRRALGYLDGVIAGTRELTGPVDTLVYAADYSDDDSRPVALYCAGSDGIRRLDPWRVTVARR